MIDTNALSQIQQAAPQVQSTLSAWNLVAAGAGAFLAHAYHSIKKAGGIKNILRGLWDGGPDWQSSPDPAAPSTPLNQTSKPTT